MSSKKEKKNGRGNIVFFGDLVVDILYLWHCKWCFAGSPYIALTRVGKNDNHSRFFRCVFNRGFSSRAI